MVSVAFVIAGVISIIVASIFTYEMRYGAALITATGGFWLGVLLNESWLFQFNNLIVSWCVVGFLTMGGFALGC